MTNFQLEIRRANARLRAWKSHGVPVEGGWRLGRSNTVNQLIYLDLELRCTRCLERWPKGLWTGLWSGPVDRTVPEEMVAKEQELARKILSRCTHLEAMCYKPPPIVTHLMELELLVDS